MKIANFRIKNYKSIKDSGICYLGNLITVLAGRNEGGKTAILEALEDFNVNKAIRNEAIPLENKELKPEIEISLKLEKNDLDNLQEKFGFKKLPNKKFTIIIKKLYPNNYSIITDPISIFVPEKKALIKKISILLEKLGENISNLPIDSDQVENIDARPNLDEYEPQFKEDLHEKERKKVNKYIEDLKFAIDKLNKIKKFEADFENFTKNEIIPNFILFSTFEDQLPDEIEISEAPNNDLIKDLGMVSNLDFNKIQPSTEPDEKKKHEKEVNIRFSEEYKQFWNQDDSNLFFWLDGPKLFFRFIENGDYFSPKIRSKGRRWHLAFYIKVTARSLEGKQNIILIDEPGLFLHAQAQRDILNKLEECSERTPIVITTHSPYLISAEKLDRVRLVIKNKKNGTKIKKITAKADKETLTPILTAIGEDLSAGIRIDKKNSIITEGYSDYLWLMAFKKILNIQDEFNIVPAVGADSAVYVGAILFGWGLDPIFILDNDKKGNNVRKKLKEKLAIDEEKIVLVPQKYEGSIENLFSEKDYRKYIKSGDSIKGKVLTALQFIRKIENGELRYSDFSEGTKENFRNLFSKLKELIE